MYKLNIREGLVQRVQFLYLEKSRIVYLLFILDGVFVHLYQVPTKFRQAGVEIASQPNLVSVVVKHFEWFEWDVQRNYLYIIQQPKINASPQNRAVEQTKEKPYMLQCYHFDKAYRVIWEVPLTMNLSDIPSIYQSRNPGYYKGFYHRACTKASRYLHMVRLNGVSFIKNFLSTNFFEII